MLKSTACAGWADGVWVCGWPGVCGSHSITWYMDHGPQMGEWYWVLHVH